MIERLFISLSCKNVSEYESCKSGTDKGRKDEYPYLFKSCTAFKYGGGKASGGVYGCSCKRNSDNVNEGKSKTDYDTCDVFSLEVTPRIVITNTKVRTISTTTAPVVSSPTLLASRKPLLPKPLSSDELVMK